MKRSAQLSLVGIGVSILTLYTACSKEQASQASKTLEQSSFLRLHNLLQNTNDPEDEHINDVLFLFANGIASFSNNNSLMAIIKNKCLLSPQKEVTYSELIATDTHFESNMNSYLITSCSQHSNDPNHNCIKHYTESMIHQGVNYYPSLLVLNVTTANWLKVPIICIGAEVDANDRILGIAVNSKGDLFDTLLSEVDVINSRLPIIIVSNGADVYDQTTDTIMYSPLPDEQSMPSVSNYIWYGYQIKPGYRYENGATNKSDLYFVITMHDQYNWLQGSSLGFPFGEHRDKIANVSASDVNAGNIIYPGANYVPLFSQNLSAANTTAYTYAYITTYERDWYASGKDVEWCRTNAPNFFNPKYHICNMKYINEWYINSACSYNLTGFMPAINYVAAIGASKMYCEFKRTN